jgi:hypothetical protein
MLRVMPQKAKEWWEPKDWGEEQALRVAQEIRRLRGRRSAQWLSDETEELGYRVSRSVIADLENGRRRYVTTAELTVFAYALGTAPAALLYPPPYDDEKIDMLPDNPATKLFAVQAFCGYPPYVNRFADLENMRPLYRAREIAQLEDQQRWLLIQLEELGELNPEVAKQIRAELHRVIERLAHLKAEQDGG